jgi:HipA-like protein
MSDVLKPEAPSRSFLDVVRDWFGLGVETFVPAEAKAEFKLVYRALVIGVLRAAQGEWTFSYSDDFQKQRELKPLVEFPDVTKKYTSKHLWPSFMMRLPSLKQTEIQDVVRREHIDVSDEVQLLRRFGHKTIASPFELVESTRK